MTKDLLQDLDPHAMVDHLRGEGVSEAVEAGLLRSPVVLVARFPSQNPPSNAAVGDMTDAADGPKGDRRAASRRDAGGGPPSNFMDDELGIRITAGRVRGLLKRLGDLVSRAEFSRNDDVDRIDSDWRTAAGFDGSCARAQPQQDR